MKELVVGLLLLIVATSILVGAMVADAAVPDPAPVFTPSPYGWPTP